MPTSLSTVLGTSIGAADLATIASRLDAVEGATETGVDETALEELFASERERIAALEPEFAARHTLESGASTPVATRESLGTSTAWRFESVVFDGVVDRNTVDVSAPGDTGAISIDSLNAAASIVLFERTGDGDLQITNDSPDTIEVSILATRIFA